MRFQPNKQSNAFLIRVTGNQGGAVAQALQGCRVLSARLTRSPQRAGTAAGRHASTLFTG